MPLASTNPSFGSTGLLPLHGNAGQCRAIEVADALRAQFAGAPEASGRFVDQPLDVDAQAGRAVRLQQLEGVAEEVDGAFVFAAQEGVAPRRDLDDPLAEGR